MRFNIAKYKIIPLSRSDDLKTHKREEGYLEAQCREEQGSNRTYFLTEALSLSHGCYKEDCCPLGLCMKRVPWKAEMAGPVPGSDVCSEMLHQLCRKEGYKKDIKKTVLNIANRISECCLGDRLEGQLLNKTALLVGGVTSNGAHFSTSGFKVDPGLIWFMQMYWGHPLSKGRCSKIFGAYVKPQQCQAINP